MLGLMAAIAISCFAQSTFSQGGTLGNTSSETRDPSVRDDQSYYANQNRRHGIIVRDWSFDIDGGEAGSGVDLGFGNPRISGAIQEGAIIIHGYIQVFEEILPFTSTNFLSIDNEGDIQSAPKGLNEEPGLLVIDPNIGDGSVGLMVVTGETSFLTLEFSGVSPTQGQIQVVMEYYLGVPPIPFVTGPPPP